MAETLTPPPANPAPASAPASAPRRRWPRWLLGGIAVVVVVPAAALGTFIATFDAEAWKPRVVEAVEGATGRKLELGRVGLKLSLVPTVTLENVALGNMPGGSRPTMLTVRRAEVELALLPLLSRRVELRRLVLQAPDLLLETDAQGRGNWVFTPPASGGDSPAPAATPGAGPGTAPATAGGPGLAGIVIGHIDINQGQAHWRDGTTGQQRNLGIRQLELKAADATAPLRLEGTLALDGRPFTLAGTFGPLTRLLDPAATSPWPVALALEAEGARLALDGSVARPQEGKGWQVAVQARVPELARLAAFVPDVPLPPLRGLELSLRAADSGAAIPALSDLRLALGESDLNALWPGLRLQSLSASLPAADRPLAITAQATARGVPLALEGSLGAPALLLPGATNRAPWPLDLTLRAATASASLKGHIADPVAQRGVDLALALRAPALEALAPLLGGAALPPLRDIALDSRIAERGNGFSGGAFLRGLTLASSAGDLAGDLTIVVGERPGVTGALTSRRLDLTALRPPATPGAAPAQAPAAPPQHDGRLIPDVPLPLEALRLTDSDLRLQVNEVVTPSLPLREVALRLRVEAGKAWLDPFTASLSGGRLSLRAAADATTDPPTIQLAATTDGLDLAALRGGLGVPALPSGRLEVDADLRGRGRNLRAVAGSAHGHLGVAMTGAQLSQTAMQTMTAGLRNQAPMLSELANRPLAIACAAGRFDLENGVAHTRALLFDTSLGKLAGEGTANLRDETLAMRLNTDLRLPVPGVNGGLRIRAPVPLGGTFLAPRPEWGAVAGAAAGGAATGALGGALGQGAEPLGQLLGGVLGGRAVPGSGGPAMPDCAHALAAARGGRAGPVPASAMPAEAAAPAPSSTPPAGQAAPAPRGLPRELQAPLRGLFGR